MPCRPPGDLPDPGIEPTSLESPALADGFFTTGTTWGPKSTILQFKNSKWSHTWHSGGNSSILDVVLSTLLVVCIGFYYKVGAITTHIDEETEALKGYIICTR